MYTAYFGFREKPFNLTPDSRFFYTNPAYQEAYATLLYGIRERKGFVVLTGEVGTGKTTLLRKVMVNLEASVRFVFFYNTTLTFEELLSFTCQEFGLAVKDPGRLAHIQALNAFLLAQMENGGTAALLIDEAQNLGEEVLENLRLLSNLETAGEKLLQIVLVGQPELETKLDQSTLRQLKQRITLHCHLSRLKDREVGPFIHHRLRAVGYEGQDLFAPETVQRVALYARGIPRLINILCDNALLIAYGASKKIVSAAMIDEAAHDLHLIEEVQAPHTAVAPAEVVPTNGSRKEIGPGSDESPRPRQRRLAWASALAILVLLGGGAVALSRLPSKERLTESGFPGKDLINQLSKRLRLAPAEEQEQPPSSAPALEAEGRQDRGAVQSTPAAELEAAPQDQGAAPANRGQSAARPLAQDGTAGQPVIEALDVPQPVELKQESIVWGEESRQLSRLPQIGDSSGAGKERPIVIQYGSTVSRIAAEVYGTNLFLGIDLSREFNSHIQNFNWVLAGETLWLPPLSQETLLRKQEDGSYHLILASFRSLSGAQRLVHAVHLKGYSVSVTPRKISDGILLYRVEIGGLNNSEAANTTWDVALTNRWLALETREEKRSRLSY